MERKRILTGIRPTRPLHLGHYAGAIDNWVKLQHEHDCSFLIADYEVSDYADDLPRVRQAVWDVALDWLAVGLDPQSSRFVIESLVPVGRDQLPHLELARETARRFKRDFAPVFPWPQALLGRVARLMGIDGREKMSKSRNNTIDLKDSAGTVASKLRRMYAGPPRAAKAAGDVAKNPVFEYLDAFDHDVAQVQDLKERYEHTGVSNEELKDRLTVVLNGVLEPMRERLAKHESNLPLVREALDQGSKNAPVIARETMERVRDALKLNYLRRTGVPSRRPLLP